MWPSVSRPSRAEPAPRLTGMSEDFTDGTGLCPHCGHHVAAHLVGQAQVSPTWDPYYARQPVPDPAQGGATGYLERMRQARDLVLVYSCQFCDRTIVLLEHSREREADDRTMTAEERTSRTMIVPAKPPRQLPEAAPAGVASIYEEASICEDAGALRAAGVLYRAATEEMVKDQGGTGRDLKAKINSLTPRLDAEVLEDRHESRVVGNDSIHAGVQYAPEEIADVAELLWEAAFVLYEQPAQKASMRAARKARHDAARGPRAAS